MQTSKSFNLTKAKLRKKDEFYTLLQDIEKEINFYLKSNPFLFKDKTILLPCDDPNKSNFTQFFIRNFHKLMLKKLISTSFNPNGKGKVFILTKENYDERFLNKDDIPAQRLNGNGDFRSNEITAFKKEADFVITNPPFSLFREFIDWTLKDNKSFLSLCCFNVATTYSIFNLIKNNKVWFGNSSGSFNFISPDIQDTKNHTIGENGEIIAKFGNIAWLTNIPFDRKNKLSNLDKTYSPKDYPNYDNFDAIEVSKVKDIPCDYKGLIGVPVTFLTKFDPNQFEIIDADFNLIKGRRFRISGKRKYFRVVIKHKH